jgi:HK97 family phage major capsid protein
MSFIRNSEEARGNLIHQVREVIDLAESEGRGLSGEDLRKIENLEGDISRLDEAIAVAKRNEERAAETAEAARGFVPAEETKSEAEIFRALAEGQLRSHTFNSEKRATLVPSANTVPVDFLDRVMMKARLVGPYLDVAEVFQRTSGSDLRIPTMTAYSTAAEYAAGSAIAESEPTFGSILLQPTKQAFLVGVANELLSDAGVDIEGVIADQAGNALGTRANTVIHAAVTAVAGSGVTAASATAFTADELLDLVFSLDGAVRALPNTGFVVNTSTLAAIRKLKDDNGAYLLDYVSGGPSTILGFPVFEQPAAASIATGTKPVFFGHLGSIKVATTGLDVAVSPDYAFNQDITTYRFVYRLAAGVANGATEIKYLEMA